MRQCDATGCYSGEGSRGKILNWLVSEIYDRHSIRLFFHGDSKNCSTWSDGRTLVVVLCDEFPLRQNEREEQVESCKWWLVYEISDRPFYPIGLCMKMQKLFYMIWWTYSSPRFYCLRQNERITGWVVQIMIMICTFAVWHCVLTLCNGCKHRVPRLHYGYSWVKGYIATIPMHCPQDTI